MHLFYVTGFKNRFSAVVHWAVSFVGRGRSERTATEQQIFGRIAMKRLRGGVSDLVSAPDPDQTAAHQRELDSRRAELEANAAEESRLTDSGERGQHEEHAAVGAE